MNLLTRQLGTAFLSVDGIGRQTFRKLLKCCQVQQLSLEEVWDHPNKVCSDFFGWSKTQIEAINNFKKKYSVSSYYSYLQSKNISVIWEEDRQYPPWLQQIPDRPILLFVKGDLELVGQLPVAVVGTRKATPYGQTATTKIVGELVAGGATIISGCMYGIDSLAHQACLHRGGTTIGVLGYGFDHYYPKNHRKFIDELLAKGGVLVSEYAPHVQPRAGNFPVRNRIVAGMSVATVVVEAAQKSGSLITAQLAAEYGREVCAVPGALTNPYSQGTKDLINQGARLITSGFEVLDAVSQMVGTINLQIRTGTELSKLVDGVKLDLSPLEQQICQQLKAEPLTIAELCHRIQSSTAEITATLSLLEINGYIVYQKEKWSINTDVIDTKS